MSLRIINFRYLAEYLQFRYTPKSFAAGNLQGIVLLYGNKLASGDWEIAVKRQQPGWVRFRVKSTCPLRDVLEEATVVAEANGWYVLSTH